MIQVGHYHTLEILRTTTVGLFLGDANGNEILLPNKYMPDTYTVGDHLEVFCYLDHEQRPVATNLQPYITLGDFALLKAEEVNHIGAFLDWGLEKHLFVPFKEQARKMVAGKWYLVYLYLDQSTGRLVASSKTNRFISNEELTVSEFDTVDLIVSRYTDLGVEVIINKKHKGLVYESDIYETVSLGQKMQGTIKKIREDNKIDVSLLQAVGYRNIEPNAQKVLEVLEQTGGFLPLHDKSDAEDIRATLAMSKKSFKKAIGTLYKQRVITIKDNGIELV